MHVVRSMMDLYDRYEPDLLDAVRAASKPSWFTTYGVQDMGYTDAETEASHVLTYRGHAVARPAARREIHPRPVRQRATPPKYAKEVDNQVAVRRIRQQRLTSEDNPLELVAVIDEAALLREIGGPAVLREQLDHLIMMAELPSVTLQVLPLRTCPVFALDGGFTLLGFAGARRAGPAVPRVRDRSAAY